MDEAAPLNRYQLAELGSLLGVPARAAMLLALVDGTALAGSGLPLPNVAKLYGRSCLDWIERRMHPGGPLGVALTAAMLEAGWLRPLPHGRALQPSAGGLRRLGLLGVPLD